MGKTLKRSKHWDDDEYFDYDDANIYEKKKHNHEERQARHIREIQDEQIYEPLKKKESKR